MRIIKRHKILTCLLLFVGFCLLQGDAAYAQTLKTDAATEKVAIAFYKTGNIIPNFDRWIKDNAPYNVTPWALREKIYDQEMQRLQLAYQAFDPKKDYLTVRTSAFLKPTEIENIEGKKTYVISTEFAKAPEALYFPYDFLNERIILMPYHLQDMMHSEVTKEQYDYIKSKVRTKKEKMKIVIRMRPFEADFSKPYKIDGLEQWVFKTKIASIELWNKNKDGSDDLVWEYTAPWYTSPHIIEVKKLYENRPKDSNFKKGTVKPTYGKFK